MALEAGCCGRDVGDELVSVMAGRRCTVFGTRGARNMTVTRDVFFDAAKGRSISSLLRLELCRCGSAMFGGLNRTRRHYLFIKLIIGCPPFFLQNAAVFAQFTVRLS